MHGSSDTAPSRTSRVSRWRNGLVLLGGTTILAGCSTTSASSNDIATRPSLVRPADQSLATLGAQRSSTARTTSTTALLSTGKPPVLPKASDGGPATFRPTSPGPLAGKVVAIDPGHNGGNFTDPNHINSIIWNGRADETCDTTGTETNAGYTEARFNFNVAEYLTADLRSEGATVVITHSSNTGVGPCVTRRAQIGNDAHANVAVSIHADGGPADGYGFAILEPVADGPNDTVVGTSDKFALDLRTAFAQATGEAISNYDGTHGLQPRDDLGGLNLTKVPKVLIECANMRNSADAAKLVAPKWQAEAAAGIASGIRTFLLGSS